MLAITPDEKPRLGAAALRAMQQPLDIDRRVRPLVVVGMRGFTTATAWAPPASMTAR